MRWLKEVHLCINRLLNRLLNTVGRKMTFFPWLCSRLFHSLYQSQCDVVLIFTFLFAFYGLLKLNAKLTYCHNVSLPFKFKRYPYLTIETLSYFKVSTKRDWSFQAIYKDISCSERLLRSFQAIYRVIPCSERLFASWTQHFCVWLSAF